MDSGRKRNESQGGGAGRVGSARELLDLLAREDAPVGWRELIALTESFQGHARSRLRKLVKGMLRNGDLVQDHQGHYHPAAADDSTGVLEGRGRNLTFAGVPVERGRGFRLRPGDRVQATVSGDTARVLEVVEYSPLPVVGELRLRGAPPLRRVRLAGVPGAGRARRAAGGRRGRQHGGRADHRRGPLRAHRRRHPGDLGASRRRPRGGDAAGEPPGAQGVARGRRARRGEAARPGAARPAPGPRVADRRAAGHHRRRNGQGLRRRGVRRAGARRLAAGGGDRRRRPLREAGQPAGPLRLGAGATRCTCPTGWCRCCRRPCPTACARCAPTSRG